MTATDHPSYQRVLQALQTVTKEAKTWRSNDGETLDKWAARRTEMAAKRLTEILFPDPPETTDDIGTL